LSDQLALLSMDLMRFLILLSIETLQLAEKRGSIATNAQEWLEGVLSSNSKQILFIRAERLLILTIIKTDLDLVQRLSRVDAFYLKKKKEMK
jgi:hypothetical protein